MRARRRIQFFRLPSLLAIGVLFTLALFALYPRQTVFEDIHFLEQPDALSIAYLHVLLRADPDNPSLRINLGHMLRKTGQGRAAERVLNPFLENDPIPYNALSDILLLRQQRVYEATRPEDRATARRRLFETLERVPDQPYSFDDKTALIDPVEDALSLAQASQLWRDMARFAPEAGERRKIARRLAELQEAQGKPGAAAGTLLDSLREDGAADSGPMVDDILRLQLAAGQPRQALSLFKSQRATTPMDTATLEQGIELARYAGANDDRLRWLQRLVDQQPDDVPLLRELLTAQLAQGDTTSALATVRRLQTQAPDLTPADRTRMAQVLDWNNLPAEALPYWSELYVEHNQPQALERATSTARSLFDWAALERLLSLAENRGHSNPDSYLLLADSRIRNGDIESALRVLDRGITRYPKAPALQERKLSLLLNSRDFNGAIAYLEQRDTLSDKQRLQLAQLYWRTRQPEAALAHLDFQPSDPGIRNDVTFMRLRLGHYLGRLRGIRDDYQAMLDRLEDEPPQVQEELLSLAILFEDYTAARHISRVRYASTNEPRYLANQAEYAAATGDWSAATDALDAWVDAFPSATNLNRYWQLRALTYHQTGRLDQADQAYREAYRLAPDDLKTLVGWGWLMLSEPERFGERLSHMLARLEAQGDPETYPVLAYGHSALGHPEQARAWFLRGLDGHRAEPEWLLSTARVLELTGRERQAEALRASIDPGRITDANTRVAYYRARGLDRLALTVLGRAATDTDQRQMAQQALDAGHALLAEAWLAQSREPDDNALLHPADLTPAQQRQRLLANLDTLESDRGSDLSRSRLRETVDLHRGAQRSIQTGVERLDLGNFAVRQTGIKGRYALDEVSVSGAASRVAPESAGRLAERPDAGAEGRLGLAWQGSRWGLQVEAASLARDEGPSPAFSVEGDWQPADRWSLQAGLEHNARAPDSAEAWWLLGRDRQSLAATYSPFSRLALTGRAERLAYHSADDDSLGSGHSLEFTADYTLFREDPAMTVTLGYQRQQLDLEPTLPASVNDELDSPLPPSALLTDEYERVGARVRWFHGEPHSLFRSTASPRGFLEVGSGYVISTDTPEIGLGAGLGWRLFGDDELALSARWASEGIDGSGRADLNLTYTLYLDR
ncbi:tetratricopeptide repeat protein [Marinobacter bohaiensis]|uniref:tetratricopeptide repeat protein n=1 Tax=Marinobacter bohaiensis TaxID=2201898 RepID=UPI000DAD31CE|nr:tetratricopeptide repeat protein [Marinobacter bohaiensis]